MSLVATELNAADAVSPADALAYSQKSGVPPVQVARGHILVQLASDTDKSIFLEQARGLGINKLKRLPGTDWYRMSITSQASPRSAAAAAMGLPGVIRAAADPIISINDFHPVIPPRDPYYLDDPDPGNDCDIVEDPTCQPEDLVDQWGLFKVGAEGAWSVTTGSPDIVIAIVDSGIDLDHDDLWENIWTNPGETAGNGIDDDGNNFVDDINGWDFSGANVGAPDDDPLSEDNNPDIPPGGEWLSDFSALPLGYRFDGDPAVGDGIDNNLEYYFLYGFFTMDIGVFHGTAVAGVVAAMTDNINPDTGLYEGIAGTCPNCSLMALRVINAEGEAFGSDAAEAIRYAADNGAHIINASWGIAPGGATADELALLEQAIQYATARGTVVVAAAGNAGTVGLYFPASMPETIAVGSSNWLDMRSDFSSYAAPGNQDILDVVAPGELIWTTGVMSAYDAWVYNGWLLFPELWYEPWRPGDDVYIGTDGTSFATPLVSGYLGLVLSHTPCATPVQLRQVLRDNAVDIGSPGYDDATGYGRLDMVVPDITCSSTENQVPVADAGPDQTVTDKGKPGQTFTLDGSGSSDPDGFIISYTWSENGSVLATEPTVQLNRVIGDYTFTLEVMDDRGAMAVDQVLVSVVAKSSDGDSGGGGGGKPDRPGKPPK